MKQKHDDISVGKEEVPAGTAAFIRLMQEFMNGAFACGEQLRETKIAEKFGLSRAAVREALNQMVSMDLMEYVPYCGYRLREYTLYNMLEWYELREAIEPMAARRLAQYRPMPVLKALEGILEQEEKATEAGEKRRADLCDHNFHLTLVGECGNRWFGNFYCQSSVAVLAQMTGSGTSGEIAEFLSLGRLLKNSEARAERAFRNTHEWHRMIFDYICDGDVDKAEKTMREHIGFHIDKIRNYLLGRESRRKQEGGARTPVSMSNIIRENTKIILSHFDAAAKHD